MERQLQELRDGQECEIDDILVQLVYTQRISEMATQLHQSDQSVDVKPSSGAWVANMDKLLDEMNTLRGRQRQSKTPNCELKYLFREV
jgi:hypothetical protein